MFETYSSWKEIGVWADKFKQFTLVLGMAAVMSDSTPLRTHMSAPGGSKRGRSARTEHTSELGRILQQGPSPCLCPYLSPHVLLVLK